MTQQAPHPRMHGISHVTGGPDPIPGLLPRGDDIADRILALAPDAFWKLNETTGAVAYDSSGNENDLTATGAFLPPLWGQAAGPPGETTAEWDDEASRVSSSPGDPMTGFTDDFTAGVWVNPGGVGELIGQGTSYHGGGGWAVMVLPTGVGVEHKFAVLVAGVPLYANNPLEFDQWYMVAVVRDTGTWKLYVDGLLQDDTSTDDPGSSPGNNTWLGNDGYSGHSTWAHSTRLSYGFIVDRPLASTDLLDLIGETTGGDGWVLELDENGDPVWVPPADVTVNGEEPSGAGTPLPTPAPPPTDPGGGTPDLDDWIVDQPFTAGGGTFTVAPKRWTTIPFTTPGVTRNSNVTGLGTVWQDIGGTADDAGWIDPADPSAILIPHDLPFLGNPVDWIQVCLQLESPQVQPDSYRALRVFETTRQKTLVQAEEARSACCEEHGGVNVYTEAGSTVYADGDTGGFDNGGHDNIMFVPNTGYAFYLNGNDWLPVEDGERMLKAGMRLVAQVWHDATTTLTFSCTASGSGSFGPYRPHLVVCQQAERAWGSPWSDWPVY